MGINSKYETSMLFPQVILIDILSNDSDKFLDRECYNAI